MWTYFNLRKDIYIPVLVFCWFEVRMICLPVEVCTSCAKLGTAILWTESPCLTVTVCVVSRCMPSLMLALPTVILCAFVAAVVGVTVVLCGLCPNVATGIAVTQMQMNFNKDLSTENL